MVILKSKYYVSENDDCSEAGVLLSWDDRHKWQQVIVILVEVLISREMGGWGGVIFLEKLFLILFLFAQINIFHIYQNEDHPYDVYSSVQALISSPKR